ncbi:hypothetical protein B0H14DRAFT_3029613 [Mycena olivaceomarginata]|nr:hypothetical protein B0H14DRAFT_3029613 [Mycena olivaceomarginata]
MDHLRNFSSWMPDYVLETQWRSRAASPTEQKSLIDRAIDSFSLSVPMIEFHPIVSHCDDAQRRWRHPHVTSRLHLRILNEQHLFNLEAYNTVHNKLQRTSSNTAHRSVCSRTYEEVGPMETRLEFSDSHHEETEWAYAPFLSAALNAAGTSRIAQASYNSTNLPVLEPSLLNDTMKVIWHISFSGRTPRKMLFSDLTAFAPVINASQSELERIEAQVQFEHQNTLRAHRFHIDSHPRRRLVAYTLGFLSGLFAFLLDVVYYRRLILTVGISIRGQWLSIASFLAWTVEELIFDSSDATEKIVLGCFYISLPVIPGADSPRLPATFAHATHAERASSRIDAKSSWRFIGTSMLILAMCLFLADPFQRDLIPSPLPPDPEATARSTAGNILSASVTAADCMSGILQLLMNHRARTFGGMYKAAVWLMVAERVLHFTVYLPAILGRIPDSAPLSLGTVIKVLPLLMQAWQAWTLPAAKAEEEEEHEN